MVDENINLCDLSDCPYTMSLQNPLAPGTVILMKGIIKERATLFTVNFYCPTRCWFFCRGDRKDVVLNFESNFHLQCISRNSSVKQKWQAEEISSSRSFPFSRGVKFVVEFFITEKNFLVHYIKIAVNGVHFCSYKPSTRLSLINSIETFGDILLDSFSIRHNQHSYPSEQLETNETCAIQPANVNDRNLRLNRPVMCPLSQKLETGYVIKISGKIKMLPLSFIICLQSHSSYWPETDVQLRIVGHYHCNPSHSMFSLSSRLNGTWERGKTVAAHRLPYPGAELELRILCDADRFRIVLQGIPLAEYMYQMPLDRIGMALADGDLCVYYILIEQE